MKCILILLDGLGDRSYPELGHLTPLQAADTPFLNRVAEKGGNGLYHAARPGQALPSENAHFSMFGYKPDEFPGRGALEALGAGIPLTEDDVAILAHFASVKAENGYLALEDDTPEVSEAEASALFNACSSYETNHVKFRLHRTHDIFGILTLNGYVFRTITDTSPFIAGRRLSAPKPWRLNRDDYFAQNAAETLYDYLRWAHQVLTAHPVNLNRQESGRPPVNGIVTQRAGQLLTIQPFIDRWGLRGLSLASGLVYQGLAKYIGMDHRKVKDSGDPGGDLADRIKTAKSELDHYDFIHIHTKTPDEAGHAKDPIAKKNVIESLDRGMAASMGPLLEHPEVLTVVTADHSTPCSGMLIHSGEPVPITFHGPGIRRDKVNRFDEVACASGALGYVRGKELMYLILNHTDRIKLQGLMNTPEDQPYWPGDYEPFRIAPE